MKTRTLLTVAVCCFVLTLLASAALAAETESAPAAGAASTGDGAPAPAPPASAPPAAGDTPAAGAPGTAPADAPLPDFLLSETGEGALGECAPAGGDGSQDPLQRSTCTDCDTPQGSCTSGAYCRSYCQDLVGEIGFCNQECNCCVCPEVPPPPPPPGEPTEHCTHAICYCDGTSPPVGDCPDGCREVGCF